MNKKGFTLIELLGIVIIISMLVIIALPLITNSVNNYSKKTDKLTLSMIKEAAKLYIDDNKNDFEENLYDYYCIPLTKLIDNEYLKEGIEISGKDITETKKIRVTYNNDYKIDLVDSKECIILEPGLYDENDVLLANWNELIEEGLDVESDLNSSTSAKNNNILNSYGDKYKLVIDGSIEKIGDFAFYKCNGLKTVLLTNKVSSIGNYAFAYSGLTSITIPRSVISIGNSAFADSGLTSITIPGNVASIGNSAFTRCYSLSSVTLQNGVRSIGDSAFYYCRSLTSIIIPSSVTSIGNNTFGYCREIVSMVVDENNSVYDSRENSNAIIETASNTLIAGCKNTLIPNSVTSIGSEAFYNSALTNIIIPSSVTSIGSRAFGYCNNLSSIVVDENNSVYDSRENSNAIIETASNTLVVGCKNTVLPSNIISIGNSAFYGCSGLTSVTIPSSVTSVGDSAFFACSGLTNVTISDGVASIGTSAFSYSKLSTITIPGSVTSVGDSTFYGCSKLTTIYYTGTATGSPWGATNATVVNE